MLKLIQRGDPKAASTGLTAGAETWPPKAMSHRVIRTCDECSSPG
jgi:hypothetical protein